jgi:hypothetical protein
MDPQPPPPEQPKTAPSHPHPLLRRVILVGLSLMLLTMVILLFSATTSPKNHVTWLTPQEMARLTKPGPLTLLKYKLMNLTAPLWTRFQGKRASISIDSNLLELSADAAQQTGLGPPFATNTQGLRAWILPATGLQEFKKHLKTASGATILSSPRVQTGDGMEAQVSTGSTVPMGGTNVWIGLAVDLTPTVIHDSIRLNLMVRSTELTGPVSTNMSSIKTNIDLACQAVLPNAQCLLVDAGTGCWFTLTPTLVDARGKPIKP